MSLLWRKVFIICHRCIIDEIKNGVSRRMCFFPAGAIRSEPYLPNFHKHMLSCSCTEVLKRYVDAMMVRALDNFSVFVCLCIPVSTNSPRMISVSCYGSLYFLLHLHFSLLVAPDLYVIWVLERFDLSVELFVPTLLTAAQLAAKKWGHEGSWICIPHPQDSSSACLGIEFAEKPVTIFTTCLMILSYDVICALYVFVCAKCLWKKCFKGRIHPPQEKGAEREAGHRKNEWIQEESRQRCRISAESEWGW